MTIRQEVDGFKVEAEFSDVGARFLSIENPMGLVCSIDLLPDQRAMQLIDWLGNTLKEYRDYCRYMECGWLV